MRKVFATAYREFKSTALTKAFIFGVVIFPLIILAIIFVVSSLNLFKSDKSAVEGELAIVDQTIGQVALSALEVRFDPEKQKEIAEQRKQAVEEQISQILPEDQLNSPMAQQMLQRIAGREADISLVPLDGDTELEPIKDRLPAEDDQLLGLIIVGERSLALPAPAADQGSNEMAAEATTGTEAAAALANNSYSFFHASKLDHDSRRDIERTIDQAIINERLQREGMDPQRIVALTTSPSSRMRTVTETGETTTAEGLEFIVPLVFMMLLWISVMTGGQYLLMSTIEEKSSRVMEVLLSATSPSQLLAGKIVGQGLVGLSVLLIYVVLGLAAAKQFGGSGILQQLPFDKVPWLIIYFLMAYFLFAALMAAVGSAVTEIREAQSLMGPIMTLLMLPLFLWFLIIENPNSAFSITLSYIPFVTPFVMILRLSQNTDPVPLWQTISATAVGFMGVFIIGWAAAKIFRVGVLMYGKPPSLLGLLKWLRQA
ncbi:MAG: ABC transporter permease [Planctomycetota bacterium]